MTATDPCWLVSAGHVLASAERAVDRRARAHGLLGRSGVDGAFVITPCRSVHSIGMKFDLDIAFLDRAGFVVKVARLRRNRIGLPVWQAHTVVEAEAGAFERWGLHVGDQLELRE
ncbi:MAG: DUF192 domain-containing protein [Actinobacteria bacterium]|uniref:Unannotated protein n=1 Tax=freshwater metagenome TaxID=449393 RepID=A0A6J6R9E8_9ZZZZ|nr:DUF192 domain-containing protein [Actinomycetota bacterium]MSW77366.1 DUF192 domain-containing protein [Actinomycetota bacterium]MSX54956.1 DUF192 domain-containing protein [Actinomycetota bacterium]MSX94441.1 DUF192 domain-containing protein [Actinomycetota bacterium]MSZ82703.1 DUF192 domain-containing protein [Actinomycetota bacterium]